MRFGSVNAKYFKFPTKTFFNNSLIWNAMSHLHLCCRWILIAHPPIALVVSLANYIPIKKIEQEIHNANVGIPVVLNHSPFLRRQHLTCFLHISWHEPQPGRLLVKFKMLCFGDYGLQRHKETEYVTYQCHLCLMVYCVDHTTWASGPAIFSRVCEYSSVYHSNLIQKLIRNEKEQMTLIYLHRWTVLTHDQKVQHEMKYFFFSAEHFSSKDWPRLFSFYNFPLFVLDADLTKPSTENSFTVWYGCDLNQASQLYIETAHSGNHEFDVIWCRNLKTKNK